jgi:hypothetical protein
MPVSRLGTEATGRMDGVDPLLEGAGATPWGPGEGAGSVTAVMLAPVDMLGSG